MVRLERTKNTVRNIFWGYIYKVISIILPFIFRTVLIRKLGAEYLGINSLFTSILQVLSLSELGFGTAMVYSMYKPIADDNRPRICALLNLYKKIYFVIGVIIMVLGIAIMPFLPYLIAGDYPSDINLYFVYFMFLLNTSISYFLFAYKGSLLSAFQRNDVESKILIVVSLIRYLLEIIGIVLTRNYYLFLFIEVISTVLVNVLKSIYTKKYYPDLRPNGMVTNDEKVQIKSNVTALMCHKIGGIILNSADNIVLSAFMGVVIVAKYANYYYIMNSITGILYIFFNGMTAGIGNSFVIESIDKNRNDFKRILYFNAWLVSWCSICLVCLYQDFMMLWVGEDYIFNDTIMFLVVIYFFIHCIRRTIITFRDGAGMWRDNKWQPIVSASFNLIINIILVQKFGVVGILISSIASMLLIDIPWESKKFCDRIGMATKEYLFLLFKYFIIATISTIIIFMLLKNIHYSLLVNLVIKGLICIFAGNALLWFFLHKQIEYDFFKNTIRRYLKRNR